MSFARSSLVVRRRAELGDEHLVDAETDPGVPTRMTCCSLARCFSSE